jgi:tRNA pseudouridine13 synthase
MIRTLPYLTPELAGVGGRIKSEPEDFVVHEVPAYLPSGAGDHLFVHFEKRGLDTPAAVQRIARALGVDPRDAGYAGLKDKHAVTRQWASFFKGDVDKARALDVDSIRILEASRHENKIRTGHLDGNRFSILVRDAEHAPDRLDAIATAIARTGAPNYFGEQRLGAETLARARAWLVLGERPPRSRFDRKFLPSAFQSTVFNEVCAERVERGELAVAIDGDLLRKEDSGGLFTTDDLDDARARVASFAVSPTGPMVGPKMRAPLGEAARREAAVFERMEVASAVPRLGKHAPGTRRSLRIRVRDLGFEYGEHGLTVRFELVAGAYATVILREFQKLA